MFGVWLDLGWIGRYFKDMSHFALAKARGFRLLQPCDLSFLLLPPLPPFLLIYHLLRFRAILQSL